MIADFVSTSRTPAQPGRWFWTLFVLEALLSTMILAGLLYTHLWKVAVEQAAAMVFVFSSALSFRRLSGRPEFGSEACKALMWAGISILMVAGFGSVLLMQYDVALGHLCR